MAQHFYQTYPIPTVTSTGPIITVPPGGPTATPDYHHVWVHTGCISHVTFWVIFGFFTAGLLGVAALAVRADRRSRAPHVVAGAMLAITATVYLLLATGRGTSPPDWVFHHPGGPGGPHGPGGGHGGGHHGGHGHGPGPGHFLPPAVPPPKVITVIHRQRVWARDFAKVLTAPLLITQLALLGGLAPLDALVAAFAAGGASFSAAVANGFARRVSFRPAWLAWILVAIFWTAATFALVLIPGLTAARLRARTTRNLFVGLTVLVFFAFVDYGVFSLLGPALNVTNLDVETLVLGITDIAAQLGFTFLLLLVPPEDPWTLPAWFAEPRAGEDGRGTYHPVGAEESVPN